MKKKMKITGVILIVLLVLSSCTNNDQKVSAEEYNIYYINKDYTGLTTKGYSNKSTDTNDLVDKLLKQMYTSKSDADYNISKPDNIKIVKYEVKDKTAHVYFDSNYSDMDNISELMCRAALVLTLTQIPGIDYVTIYVNDQTLLNSDDNPVGSMKSDDFVSLLEDSLPINQTITTVLYYANKKGDKLIPYTYTGEYNKNESLEEFIIKKLMDDVPGKDLYRTIPKDVELINVATKDGICYVNFSDSFLVESLDITNDVAIYSIVNSLFETNYIKKVQITVSGEKDKLYHESVSLNKMFVRNLDIVETKDK
jgi:germination protein M